MSRTTATRGSARWHPCPPATTPGTCRAPSDAVTAPRMRPRPHRPSRPSHVRVAQSLRVSQAVAGTSPAPCPSESFLGRGAPATDGCASPLGRGVPVCRLPRALPPRPSRPSHVRGHSDRVLRVPSRPSPFPSESLPIRVPFRRGHSDRVARPPSRLSGGAPQCRAAPPHRRRRRIAGVTDRARAAPVSYNTVMLCNATAGPVLLYVIKCYITCYNL